MAEWTQCPSCQLKHAVRPDGRCPRCGQPILPSVSWANVAEAQAAAPAPAPGYAAEPFEVGRFLRVTFLTWGRNAPWVVPLALVLHAPIAYAMYVLYSRMGSPGAKPDYEAMGIRFAVALGLMLLLTPLELVAFARAGVRRARGEPVGLGDMLGEAARAYFPAFGLLFVVGLAYTASLCTIVGPAFLFTAWAASVPALSEERLGPIRALRRSGELTKGLRWQVFGGFLVLMLAVWACACVVQSVAMVAVIGTVAATARGGGQEPFASSMGGLQAVNMLAQGVVLSLLTTGTAVAYQQLRVATDGPPTAQLERVFE